MREITPAQRRAAINEKRRRDFERSQKTHTYILRVA